MERLIIWYTNNHISWDEYKKPRFFDSTTTFRISLKYLKNQKELQSHLNQSEIPNSSLLLAPMTKAVKSEGYVEKQTVSP